MMVMVMMVMEIVVRMVFMLVMVVLILLKFWVLVVCWMISVVSGRMMGRMCWVSEDWFMFFFLECGG